LERGGGNVRSSGSENQSQELTTFASLDSYMDTGPSRPKEAVCIHSATRSKEALNAHTIPTDTMIEEYQQNSGVVRVPEPVAERIEYSNSHQ
jgi:hypothetical protein